MARVLVAHRQLVDTGEFTLKVTRTRVPGCCQKSEMAWELSKHVTSLNRLSELWILGFPGPL